MGCLLACLRYLTYFCFNHFKSLCKWIYVQRDNFAADTEHWFSSYRLLRRKANRGKVVVMVVEVVPQRSAVFYPPPPHYLFLSIVLHGPAWVCLLLHVESICHLVLCNLPRSANSSFKASSFPGRLATLMFANALLNPFRDPSCTMHDARIFYSVRDLNVVWHFEDVRKYSLVRWNVVSLSVVSRGKLARIKIHARFDALYV